MNGAKFNRLFLILFLVVSLISVLFIFGSSKASEEGLTLGPQYEITHPGKGHKVHISDASVAVTSEGKPLIAWVSQEGETNNVYITSPEEGEEKFVRVNPDGTSADSIHQAPGIAAGPGGEVYLSWSSKKPMPEGVLFASDLYISRSSNGGQSFDHHLRVNEDLSISHSFEGIDVSSDSTLYVSWIDSREGWNNPATFLARIIDRGTKIDRTVKLDDSTCVCCRVDVATGPKNEVAVLWRKVFPENIRDMVMAVSSGGLITRPKLVHADGWKINACPHRGGSVAFDREGNKYVVWYTEGNDEKPSLLFAVSSDGENFSPPKRLDESAGSIPDHLRMAVSKDGKAVMVWEDSTAVRRRVLLRYTTDRGKTFSPVHTLSQAIKAYAPDVTAEPDGDFVVSWHEEQFPVTKTIVQHFGQNGAD